MRGVDQDRERQARAHVRAALKRHSWLFSPEGNEKFYRAHMEVADDEILAEMARVGEKTALEILRKRLRLLYETAVREGRPDWPVHERVNLLALEVFIYGLPKARSGPKPTRTGLRKTSIALLVQTIHVDYGFPIYGGAANRGNPNAPLSAQRLVGEELGLTEHAVDQIWRDRRGMLRPRIPPAN
jgi:hypothetical protein